MKLRCLLIDDEPPALKVLASYISSINGLEIAGPNEVENKDRRDADGHLFLTSQIFFEPRPGQIQLTDLLYQHLIHYCIGIEVQLLMHLLLLCPQRLHLETFFYS